MGSCLSTPRRPHFWSLATMPRPLASSPHFCGTILPTTAGKGIWVISPLEQQILGISLFLKGDQRLSSSFAQPPVPFCRWRPPTTQELETKVQ